MDNVLNFLIELRYIAVFVGTFFEGPAIGLLAGVFSKIGYFSLPAVYAVHVAADFSSDLFYYAIGYFGGHKALPKITKFLKISPEETEKNERLFHKHGEKILMMGKITHFIGFPIIIGAGLAKYPLIKFAIFDLLATLIKSAGLVALGFFFGNYWDNINNVLSDLALTGILVISVPVIYFVIKKIKK